MSKGEEENIAHWIIRISTNIVTKVWDNYEFEIHSITSRKYVWNSEFFAWCDQIISKNVFVRNKFLLVTQYIHRTNSKQTEAIKRQLWLHVQKVLII